MPTPCLLASADSSLYLNIREAFGSGALVDLIATDASMALEKFVESASREVILVLDAQLPLTPNLPPDREEKAALWLLQQLRARGIRRPALVITSRPMGISEIDEYCSPDNGAIALPRRHLVGPMLAGFVLMLRDRPNALEPTWDVVEIEVKRTSVKCFIGSRDGRMVVWGEASTNYYSAVQVLSHRYANADLNQGWARRMHDAGSLLFRDLIISTIGPGLFSHLEQAAGGLENLAFRFRVDDPTLYSVPFEAAVRLSGQPISGTEDDFNQSPFVLVNAPITRRMKGVSLRTGGRELAVPKPARVLFIRSQVGENPAGTTASDTVAVPETDQAAGRTRIKQMEFRRLENIDRELQTLRELQDANPDILSLQELDLSRERDPAGAETVLMRKLTSCHFDVVHFAGHSLTTKSSLTLLVLPGEHPGAAEGVAVQTFADGAAATGARLVYLSSCQGSSANTVASLGQRNVPCVLGFRWDVDDERAADFAKFFYTELFNRKTICGAFRAACRGVYQPQQIEASPIWASPILASQTDDWMAQRVV
jgi:CHAT domain